MGSAGLVDPRLPACSAKAHPPQAAELMNMTKNKHNRQRGVAVLGFISLICIKMKAFYALGNSPLIFTSVSTP